MPPPNHTTRRYGDPSSAHLLTGMIEVRHATSTRHARSIYRAMHHRGELKRPHRFWSWLADLVDLPPNSHWLDVACGDGAFAPHLRRRGVRCVGLDADRLTLRAAPGGARRGDLAMVAADGHALPFPRDAFDGISNVGSLEHFDDPLAGVEEMARVLRPGGLALVLVPNSMGLRGPVLRAWRSGEIIDDGQPIQRYGTLEQWRRLLMAGGLRPERVLGCESLAPWPRRPREWLDWLRHPSRLLLPLEHYLPPSMSVELVFLCRHGSEIAPASDRSNGRRRGPAAARPTAPHPNPSGPPARLRPAPPFDPPAAANVR